MKTLKAHNCYTCPDIEVHTLETKSCFLIGSVTKITIKPGNVTVADFSDGFADQGGFKDLSFD